LTTTMYFNWWF